MAQGIQAYVNLVAGGRFILYLFGEGPRDIYLFFINTSQMYLFAIPMRNKIGFISAGGNNVPFSPIKFKGPWGNRGGRGSPASM